MRSVLIAGNWKMSTTRASACELASAIARQQAATRPGLEVLVCPPFPYLISVREALGTSAVRLGAQNVYFEPPGAFTGEVAAEMLLDVGCQYVIVGHSERRHVLRETDEDVSKKVDRLLQVGLKPVLCVGELLAEREANQTESVLARQMAGGLEGRSAADLQKIVIAYEPVWAIGTGKTASPEQADSAHKYLRNWLASRYNPGVAEQMQILYGGSVKPDNAETLLRQPNVDGALVGGASLKAESFLAIVQAAVNVIAS